MKKRRLISVLLCISLFFAGGCGQKTAEKQPEIQETAEQTAKETHKAERGTRQESVQGNTPEAGQEEAVTVTGAAAALPMLVDYDYEAEYDQDSYGRTILSKPLPLLFPTIKLSRLDKDTLEYRLLYTQMLRNRNRVADAVLTACEYAELFLAQK